MRYYRITEFARMLSVSPQTLRMWEKEGKLIPSHRTVGGHRCYSHKQLEEYLEKNKASGKKEG